MRIGNDERKQKCREDDEGECGGWRVEGDEEDEGWRIKDKGWRMKDEGWKMKDIKRDRDIEKDIEKKDKVKERYEVWKMKGEMTKVVVEIFTYISQ